MSRVAQHCRFAYLERNLVVRTEREAVLVPRFNVKKQQSFAVDGTARGSGRACPYAGPGE